MAWKKSPPELIAVFERAAPKDERAHRRPMFGYPALFANGNMFASTYQDKIVVRLPDAERSQLLKLKDASPFEPMPGRPMKEYAVVPPRLSAKPSTLAPWVEKAFRYALTLPAKKKT